MAPTARTKIFVSYSHKDERWLDELRTHLTALDDVLDVWDDTRLAPGKRWRPQIETALAEARVALLLVSPDFLASSFIKDHEVPALLDAADAEGVPLLYVYVRPSLAERRQYAYTDTATGEPRVLTLPEFQGLNSPDEALSTLKKPQREQRLVEIARRIQDAAQAIAAPTAATPNLAPYLAALRENTRWLRLRGLGETSAQQVELERVYTKLRVASSVDGAASLRGRKDGEGVDKPGAGREGEPGEVELKDLLGRHAHLVLVGDPGAGKTTFLRFVALNLSRAWLDDERAGSLERLGWRGAPPFPLLVSLGEFGQFLESARRRAPGRLARALLSLARRLRACGPRCARAGVSTPSDSISTTPSPPHAGERDGVSGTHLVDAGIFASSDAALGRPRRAVEQELLPSDRRHVRSLSGRASTRATEDERAEARMTARELQQPREVTHLESAGLHLDGPLAPAPFQDRIDLEWLLAPVRDALTAVPRMRQAGVLDPCAEARRVA
jgi:hypothetical protein